MGIILSRFKKKESTKEILKKIQEDIDRYEEYSERTEQTRKKLVGRLLICSFLLCIAASVIYYFYYLPPTLNEKLLFLTPFIGFILLIYIVKLILTWYYRWKVRRNEKKLLGLKEKKSEILNQVMETETYKVAKEILEIYAPEQLHKSLSLRTPVTSQILSGSQSNVRRRVVAATPAMKQGNNTPIVYPVPPGGGLSFIRPQTSPGGGMGGASPAVRPRMTSPTPRSAIPLGPRIAYSATSRGNLESYQRRDVQQTPQAADFNVPPGPPMPRPILPRERGLLDRFVEYLVGDGPSNRYALVCRQCESHNGMALRDEFPYIAFRCAYCYYWNPARKQKPVPPKLETLASDQIEKILQKEAAAEETSSEEEGEGKDKKVSGNEGRNEGSPLGTDSNGCSSSNKSSSEEESDVEDIPRRPSITECEAELFSEGKPEPQVSVKSSAKEEASPPEESPEISLEQRSDNPTSDSSASLISSADFSSSVSQSSKSSAEEVSSESPREETTEAVQE